MVEDGVEEPFKLNSNSQQFLFKRRGDRNSTEDCSAACLYFQTRRLGSPHCNF
uniref:Uncharacterized protein n=1 Tax=Picea sitchensis TaxID=3332 RepID=A9NQS5_PICSI|nr:unknown [Picea sitchensis]